MSKAMKMCKSQLASIEIKPTNRNARRYLHCLRKLERKVRAEAKWFKSYTKV